jgi:hypothetical protein
MLSAFALTFAAAITALPLRPDPLAPAATLSARITDPAVIRAAVREAVAGAPATENRKDAALSGGAYRGFAEAVDEARVPDCLHPDALKHQPAKIGPIGVGGIYALPFLAAAILRGKCN